MDYDGGGQGHYGARRPGGGYGGGGHKRKRESEPIDPLKQLLHALIYLGDDALPVRRAAGSEARGGRQGPSARAARRRLPHVPRQQFRFALGHSLRTRHLTPPALPGCCAALCQTLEVEEEAVLALVKQVRCSALCGEGGALHVLAKPLRSLLVSCLATGSSQHRASLAALSALLRAGAA